MAETDLERCARAMHAGHIASGRADEFEWDELPEVAHDDYFSDARAVLAALREPSARMRGAGRDIYCVDAGGHVSGLGARTIFRAMIDAALAEKG